MTERYQPRYQWRRTQLDEDMEPTDLDWLGYDGDQYIGRIRKEIAGPTKGKWQWAASYPRLMRGPKPLPNTGFVDTARIATRKVEEFWDMCMGRMRDQNSAV